MGNACGTGSKRCNRTIKGNRSWLPAIVVALLPKCPFCIMAYSGAISMCSGNTIYPNAGGYSAYITLCIASLVILSILLNNKGQRSVVASLIATAGIISIGASQFLYLGAVSYYLGVVLLFFGIWYNGSFFYFYRKYIQNSMNYISKLY